MTGSVYTTEELTDEDIVNKFKDNTNKNILYEEQAEEPESTKVIFNEPFKTNRI